MKILNFFFKVDVGVIVPDMCLYACKANFIKIRCFFYGMMSLVPIV